jgi:hypothetical protein
VAGLILRRTASGVALEEAKSASTIHTAGALRTQGEEGGITEVLTVVLTVYRHSKCPRECQYPKSFGDW